MARAHRSRTSATVASEFQALGSQSPLVQHSGQTVIPIRRAVVPQRNNSDHKRYYKKRYSPKLTHTAMSPARMKKAALLSQAQNGFTLIEMMVVVTVLA